MKISDRGYWVSKLFFYQSFLYYFYYCLKFRSFTFFAACNPAIKLGGMLDDKKSEIIKLLPSAYIPKTIIANHVDNIQSQLELAEIEFPVILKPNIGFKGMLVKKVHSLEELKYNLKDHSERQMIIQEFLDEKREFSVMFYRYPISGDNGILSLVEKEYPYLIADGISDLKTLIDQHKNPFLDKDQVRINYKQDLNSIPSEGTKIILDQIGNYSRGAAFVSFQSHISDQLVEGIKKLFDATPDIDYCRLDIKANSILDVEDSHFRILEINGAKSEPLHIYDKRHSFLSNMRDIHLHWIHLGAIVKERKSMSYDFPTFKYGFKSLQATKKIMK